MVAIDRLSIEVNMNNLTAISPIDGRYHYKTLDLVNYFSESAIIKRRLIVEIEYLIALRKAIPYVHGLINEDLIKKLRSIPLNHIDNALRIKNIEGTTKHDVKAIEYFLSDKLRDMGVPELVNFVHFGLTSQDICSVALSKTLYDFHYDVLLDLINKVSNGISSMVQKYDTVRMLSRTHGQPATPTYLGKEINVFAYRLHREMYMLNDIKLTAKFGGAVGNFNAHKIAYPIFNWEQFATDFLNSAFKLQRSLVTTQVDGNDSMVEYFDRIKRINNILIDFCRDIWMYISMGYFKLAIVGDEVGSSTMPHKVNPIDFENAEGNLGMANAIFTHIGSVVQISRLQRDLTDSTVLRNVGVPFAHSVLAYGSIINGISKLEPDVDKIYIDLENNWSVVAEGIQTVLRREGFNDAYKALKDLTRTNSNITQVDINRFIMDLEISDDLKYELSKITPFTYAGT